MTTAPRHPAPHTANPGGVIVDVIEDDGDWRVLGSEETAAALVTAAVEAVALAVPLADWPGTAVAVALSNDSAVAALNGQYRGKPKPTNVLSFPAGPGAEAGFLGDIVLAQETVVREADEQATAVADHLTHLVVHGVLHLIGYDHETRDEAERMESLEVTILKGLGIANPYAGRPLEP